MRKTILCSIVLLALSTATKAQFHAAVYGGMAIPAAANTSYSLNPGSAFGVQLLYEIPSVEGLSVGVQADLFGGKGDSVSAYRFLPVTVGVNYVWQFTETYGLSTHIGVGFNSRNVELTHADNDKGVTFAYRVGLDLLVAKHFSLGFRWNGMGNVAAYESVPVAWNDDGTPTRYQQQPTNSDEFSLGFFTLIAGLRF